MIPFKKSKFTKQTVQMLFYFTILLSLVLLILNNSVWLSISLLKQVTKLSAIPNFSRKFQDSNPLKVNDSYIEIPQNQSTNPSFTTTNISTPLYKTLHRYDYIINEPDKCKEHVPFLVLLVTVERKQLAARQAIRNTWGKEDLLPGVKILRLFFLGKDAKLNTTAQLDIFQESQKYHDIIQQDYLDTYENLTIKVVTAMNWIASYCPNALYAMKTDHDVFVNTEYLVKKILKPDQEPKRNYFTGYLMQNNVPDRNTESKWYVSPDQYPGSKYPPFCSGTGYVFSGDLSHRIVEISSRVRWIYLEDVFIGFCLYKLGVQPVAPPKRSDFNNWVVMFSVCGYNNIVTAHFVNPQKLLEYWDSVQKNKHRCF